MDFIKVVRGDMNIEEQINKVCDQVGNHFRSPCAWSDIEEGVGELGFSVKFKIFLDTEYGTMHQAFRFNKRMFEINNESTIKTQVILVLESMIEGQE